MITIIKNTKNTVKTMLFMMLCICIIIGNGIASNAEATPRLMITGYEITEGHAIAGEEFTVTFHMKNESKKTALSNIKFTIETADNEFIPVDSSSLFVEKIEKEEEYDISFKVKARNDLEQKPYTLTLKAQYEGRYEMSYESSDNITIAITQVPSILITETDILPGKINVGAKTNVMFNINNIGKSNVYKTTVTVEGDGISPTVTYVGDILPGAVGYYDALVLGEEVTSPDGKIKATITYEDLDGNQYTQTQEFNLEVEAEKTIVEEVTEVVVEKKQKFPMAAVVGIVVAIIVVILIVKAKKSKNDDYLD